MTVPAPSPALDRRGVLDLLARRAGVEWVALLQQLLDRDRALYVAATRCARGPRTSARLN